MKNSKDKVLKYGEFVQNNPSANLVYHLENKISVLNNIFRPHSESFFELLKESREHKDLLGWDDRELFEQTDLGLWGEFEGDLVPLDFPFIEDNSVLESEYKGKKVSLNMPTRSSGPKKYKVYVKNPKTGNVKVVHFGDLKGGLTAKISDPKARKAFSKRHGCDTRHKDKTKAGYWSCRLTKFPHLFSTKKTYSGFW